MKYLAAILILLSSAFVRADEVFSIVNWPDFHMRLDGHGTSEAQAAVAKAWILAHTNDGTYNIRGFILNGDNCEQGPSDGINGIDSDPLKFSLVEGTNWFNDMRLAGLFVLINDGNHDADNFDLDGDGKPDKDWSNQLDPSILQYAWTNIWPLSFFTVQTNIPGVGFVTNLDGGKMSQRCVMTYVNPATGIKLLWLPLSTSMYVITNGVRADIAAQTRPQMDQLRTIAAQYPDYNAIGGCHFTLSWSVTVPFPNLRSDFAEGNGNPWTERYFFIPHGSAPFETGARDIPNLLMWTSGHNRGLWSGHTEVTATDGHLIDVQCFNMQLGGAGNGAWNGKYIKIIRFNKTLGRVEMRVVDVDSGTEKAEQFQRDIGGKNFPYETSWNIPLLFPRYQRVLFR